MSFFDELKRRNVVKVGIAYLVVAWLLAQVVALVLPTFGAPEWIQQTVIFLLILGFPLALFFAWAYEVTPEGIKRTRNVPLAESITRDTGQKLNYVVTGLLVVAVVFLVVDRIGFDRGRTQQSVVGRLAVLPCDNLSPDTENAYFAPGIHEELLNRLAQIRGLEVISRSSVLQYAQSRPSIPEIGRALDVDSVMECSVRYDGNRLMLTAQLIDAVEDIHLWSQAYPADMNDLKTLFETQADIAMNVANAIRVEYFADEIEQIQELPTESREAYELLLAARETFRLPTLENGERALSLLDRATSIDPEYVDAWVETSNIRNIIAGFREGNGAARELELSQEAAERALAIEPDSGLIVANLGYVYQQMGNWVEAQRLYQRGFDMGAPLHALPALSVFQMAVGNFGEARETLEANLRIDPMNHVAAGFLLATYEMTGARELRVNGFSRGEDLFGTWFGEDIETFLRLGDADAAAVFGLQNAGSSVFQQIAAIVSEQVDTPARAMDSLVALYTQPEFRTPLASLQVAAWAAYLGAVEQSLEWLESGLTATPVNVWIAWLPVFDDVRADDRFTDLIERAGLPEYWNEFGWPQFCSPNAASFDCS